MSTFSKQGSEPAAFLNLWCGRMVVHLGRRGSSDDSKSSKPRLYVVRGEMAEEAHCVQVAQQHFTIFLEFYLNLKSKSFKSVIS